MTYIYLIGWEKKGPVKIGVADDVKRRLKGVQTGNPYKLRIYGSRPIITRELAFAAEMVLHSHLWEKRMIGEWFDITIEEAKRIAGAVLGEYQSKEELDPIDQTKQIRHAVMAIHRLSHRHAKSRKNPETKSEMIRKRMKLHPEIDELLNFKDNDYY